MGDNWCDKYLTEHEKFLRDHTMMYAFPAKAKTLYQLDLETKDRKPNLIPKVGDKVKIKSREWYEKWKDTEGDVHFSLRPNYFAKDMAKYCGRILTVRDVFGGRFHLNGTDRAWMWLPEFIEEVYPQKVQVDAGCGDSIVLPNNLLGSIWTISPEEQERIRPQLRDKWGVKPKLIQMKTTRLIKLNKV